MKHILPFFLLGAVVMGLATLGSGAVQDEKGGTDEVRVVELDITGMT